MFYDYDEIKDRFWFFEEPIFSYGNDYGQSKRSDIIELVEQPTGVYAMAEPIE